MKHVNDRHPNFEENGKFYLERCYACDPDRGRENYGPAVASGSCAWCGWEDKVEEPVESESPETSYAFPALVTPRRRNSRRKRTDE